VGTILVLVVVVYLLAYLVAGDKMPKNAQISGIAVGGLTRAAAIDKLSTELGPRATAPMDLTINDKTTQIRPAEAGLSVDYAASIDAAGGGRSLDPRQIFKVLTGGAASDPVVVVDDAKLTAAVQQLAAASDRPPVDASLAYRKAKIRQTDAQVGVTLQQATAATVIEEGYLVDRGAIQLPAELSQPEITDEEADMVVENFARPAVSAPVKVRAGGAGSFKITPRMIAGAITFVPENGTLKPVLDATKLRENAADAVKTVELTKPRNATVRIVRGKPKVIPAVNGTAVSAEDLKSAVEPALTESGRGRTVSVELTGAKAKFSTADAKKLGIKKVTGEFTTYYPYLRYRDINIGRAAELINNTLLKPGEVFSLNGIVGERTPANGFVKGFIIKGGKFKEELGGGVSQSATTTFNAMFFAGLKDIQHQPHSLYIDRYPAGREATVAWPSLDLKFQNDTKYGVLVQAFRKPGAGSGRGSITVRMWSTKTYDKVDSTTPSRSNFRSGKNVEDHSPDCVPMTPVPGFDVSYQRRFYNNGKVVRRENFFWRYAPTDRVRCV
jgi:vancomycin resistance protein YoaR